jgi:Tfp pilus assembly protein PilV
MLYHKESMSTKANKWKPTDPMIKNQSGMASILITMITMVVISLIVLGFATISRREQGNTLDQQLSTQAFYAAESGVEDAAHTIVAAVKAGVAVPGKRNCTTYDNGDSNYNPMYVYPTGGATTLDSTHNVSYSCLLVDPGPTSLIYKGVSDNSVVVPLVATQNINQIVVSWSPSTAPGGTPASCPGSTNGSFAIAPKWKCGYGMLRTDVVSTQGALTRANLDSNALASFFEPLKVAAGGNLSFAGNVGKANVTAASCDTAAYTKCTVTITGLPASNNFTMRLSSLYKTSDITIQAIHGGAPIPTTGAQATIDVTGNANGVLRRIQVRLPINDYNGIIPDYGLQTNGAVCKRFLVTPGYFSVPNDIVNPDASNSMCVSQTSGAPAAGG